jgi:hypothetical protein
MVAPPAEGSGSVRPQSVLLASCSRPRAPHAGASSWKACLADAVSSQVRNNKIELPREI